MSNQIDSSNMQILGKKWDLSKGNVFLIDLTDAGMPVRQLNLPDQKKVPDPVDLIRDSSLVRKFAERFMRGISEQDSEIAEFLKCCGDASLETPPRLFAKGNPKKVGTGRLPLWNATTKSARIEFFNLQEQEVKLLAKYDEKHPHLVEMRKRLAMLQKLIPEIPEDEEYLAAAANELRELMELRFRENTLLRYDRADDSEFTDVQARIAELKKTISEIRQQAADSSSGKQGSGHKLDEKKTDVVQTDELKIRRKARDELQLLKSREEGLLESLGERHPFVLDLLERITVLEDLIIGRAVYVDAKDVIQRQVDSAASEMEASHLFRLRLRELELADTFGDGHPSLESVREQIEIAEEHISALKQQDAVGKEPRFEIFPFETKLLQQIQASDQESLQGSWQVIDMEGAGDSMSSALGSEMRLEFEKNTLTQVTGEKRMKTIFVLEGSTPYMSIDYVFGEEQGIGIYDIQGDILRMCINNTIRPKELKSIEKDRKGRPLQNNFVMTLKRLPAEGITKRRSRYTAEEVRIEGFAKNFDGGIFLWVTPLYEPTWYCPGANLIDHEEGIEVEFVRARKGDKPKVQITADRKMLPRLGISLPHDDIRAAKADFRDPKLKKLLIRGADGKLIDLKSRFAIGGWE
ncbi:MAG: TIGR03067 domain-containing protein [Planctomycetota bacterium]